MLTQSYSRHTSFCRGQKTQFSVNEVDHQKIITIQKFRKIFSIVSPVDSQGEKILPCSKGDTTRLQSKWNLVLTLITRKADYSDDRWRLLLWHQIFSCINLDIQHKTIEEIKQDTLTHEIRSFQTLKFQILLTKQKVYDIIHNRLRNTTQTKLYSGQATSIELCPWANNIWRGFCLINL